MLDHPKLLKDALSSVKRSDAVRLCRKFLTEQLAPRQPHPPTSPGVSCMETITVSFRLLLERRTFTDLVGRLFYDEFSCFQLTSDGDLIAGCGSFANVDPVSMPI